MSAPLPRKYVVCAWLEDDAGRVLLTQRKAGTHLAHAWEFPGGKVEAGETPEAALARELREELGIEATVLGSLGRVEHQYTAKDGSPWVVDLHLFAVRHDKGELQALDVAAMQFVSRDWLRENLAVLPPADAPLVAQALLTLSAR